MSDKAFEQKVKSELRNFDDRLATLEDYIGSAEEWLERLDDALSKLDMIVSAELTTIDDYR